MRLCGQMELTGERCAGNKCWVSGEIIGRGSEETVRQRGGSPVLFLSFRAESLFGSVTSGVARGFCISRLRHLRARMSVPGWITTGSIFNVDVVRR